ncbi:beta strand repeat-containing protein, partial [Rodentibacter pneumotropicus]
NLNSTNGTITNLNSTNGTITNLNSTNGTITNLNSTNGTITNLNSTNGTITNLNSTNGTITNLTSENGTFSKNLTSTGETLLSGNTTVGGQGKTFTVANGTTVNMGGNVISNITEGTNATDAATKGQLDTVEQNITNNLTALSNNPLTFTGNSGNTNRKLGETLNISGAATTSGDYSSKNVKTVVTEGKVEIQIAEKPEFETISTTGDATIGGNSTVKGNSTVEGDSTVKGTTTTKDLNVTNNANIEKDLTVKGNSTVNGNSTVEGDSTVKGTTTTKDLNVTNNTNIEKDLTVKGNSTVKGDSTVEGTTTTKDLNVTNNATVNNLTATNGTITNLTSANGTFSNNLTSTGETLLSGNTTVGGQGKTFTVANGTKVDMGGNVISNITDGNISEGSKDAITGGQLHTTIQNITNSLTNQGMNFTGNNGVVVTRKLGETLTVQGSLAENKEADSSNIRTVANATTGAIEIVMAKDPTFRNLTATGNTTVGGDLGVNGTTTTKDLNVTNNANIEKDLTVKGNSTVDGNSTVNGTTTTKDLNVTNNANIEKDLTVKGNSTVDGNSTVNGTTTTKDLNVTNNANIEKDLTVKGNSTVKGSSTVESDSTVKGNATVEGTTTTKDLTVTNNATVNNLTATNGTITNLTSENGTFSNNLTSTGETVLSGNTTVGGQGKTFTVANGTKVDMGGNVISNITDGNISEGSKDAITGGQLHTTIQNITSSLTDKGLSFTGNSGNTSRKLGETLNITGTATTSGNYSSKNVKTVVTEGKVEIQIAEKPEFETISTTGDVTIGGNSTVNGDSTVKGNATFEKNTVTKGNAT